MNQVLTKWFCNYLQIKVTPNSLFLGFDPKPIIPYMIDESIDLEIAILEGRHLFPGIKKGSDCNIQVKWEIIGSNVDTCMGTSKGMIFFSIFFFPIHLWQFCSFQLLTTHLIPNGMKSSMWV